MANDNLGRFLANRNAGWVDFFRKLFLHPANWIIVAANVSLFFIPGINLQESSITFLWIYLAQSMLVGVFHVVKLCTYKFKNQAGQDSGQNRFLIALFFIIHFGFFHLVYSIFLPPKGVNGVVLLEGAGIFLLALIINTIRNFQHENSGYYSTADFMFLPYVRIIPIHFAIILGGFFSTAFGNYLPVLIVLAIVKTLMELGMEYLQSLGISIHELNQK